MSTLAGCAIADLNPAPDWPEDPSTTRPSSTFTSSSSSSSSSSGSSRYDAGGSADASRKDSGVVVSFGPFFGSCLLELANGQVKKSISFWVTSKEDEDASSLEMTLGVLELSNGMPPTTLTSRNILSSTKLTGSIAQDSFDVTTTTLAISGLANPISGSGLVIQSPHLRGRFSPTGFCARLTGHVIQPVAAERDLDESKNVCLFSPVQNGDTAPVRDYSDYSVSKCPL